MAFTCDGCGQDYYGSSRQGHLEPESFECLSCHRSLEMNSMAVRPTVGFSGSPMLRQVTPWKARHGNVIKRWILMVGASLASPVRLASGLPVDRCLQIAFVFLVGNAIVFSGLQLIPFFAFFGFGMIQIGVPQSWLFFLVTYLIWVGSIATATIVLAFISGSLSHLILVVGRQRDEGLSRTLSSMMVTSAPMCLLVLPCLGVYLSPAVVIWWMVSFALALESLHGTSKFFAFFAAFAPLLSILILSVASGIVLYI
ncbi:MAG: hypothetical protein CMJ33_01610 [Phycisphaerae bacterium]|nr:hypothetical protein [Phycisphaerae bacterium]